MKHQDQVVYQVGDLVNEMRRLMEASYPEVWIEGELSSLSKPASGHLYFSLKDEQSQIRCAMFKGRASVNRYQPKAGDLVRVRAKISVYPARGDLQCIVQYMEDAGEGVLQRRFEELKHKLNAEGLFSSEHKLLIPSMPQRIGLITSPSGAAINDILTTLKRRSPSIPVTVYPAVVQGAEAPRALIAAINDAVQHQRVDVLILSRGGGSLEDLWCFNDESLARAIFDCPIPVVSAVGHEVDVTISDLVADLRAPTPTAAAELLSPDHSKLDEQIKLNSRRLYSSTQRYLERQAQRVDMLSQRLVHPRKALHDNLQRLNQLNRQLNRAASETVVGHRRDLGITLQRLRRQLPTDRLNRNKDTLQQLSRRLLQEQKRTLSDHQKLTVSLGKQLDSVSPLSTLGRGFAIARDADNTILRTSAAVSIGDSVSVELSQGQLHCRIEDVEPDGE